MFYKKIAPNGLLFGTLVKPDDTLAAVRPIVIDGKPQKKFWATAALHRCLDPETQQIKTIPSGFMFDGATIPAIFWWPLRLHPFSPRIVTAALEHDFNYYTRRDRKASDQLFYTTLKKHGIDKLRAWLMYAAVRSAGWIFYLPDGHWLKNLITKASS